jgi:hypothetical protein
MRRPAMRRPPTDKLSTAERQELADILAQIELTFAPCSSDEPFAAECLEEVLRRTRKLSRWLSAMGAGPCEPLGWRQVAPRIREAQRLCAGKISAQREDELERWQISAAFAMVHLKV